MDTSILKCVDEWSLSTVILRIDQLSLIIESGDYGTSFHQLIKTALWQIKPFSAVVDMPSLPFKKHSWLSVEFLGSYCVHVMDLHSANKNQYFTFRKFLRLHIPFDLSVILVLYPAQESIQLARLGEYMDAKSLA